MVHFIKIGLLGFYSLLLVFWPAKVFSHEIIEPLVMLYEELAEFGDHRRVYARVLPTFCLAEAFVRGVVAQAVESFRFIEVEVFSSCHKIQPLY